MHYSVAALVALASLAAALPSPTVKSSAKVTTTVKSSAKTTTTHAPLLIDDAALLFNKIDLHDIPQVSSHIITVTPATPKSSAVPPKPTVVAATTGSIVTKVAPGMPSNNVQVKPPMNTPLSSVIGSMSKARDTVPRELSGRACQNYPYCCPDPRYLNENTNFPYSVIGRFWSPVGSCTGTLVGPRHVLTAAHCISWLNCFASFSGQLQFAVDYWPGHAPAIFYGSQVYHYDASKCGDPVNVAQEAVDYVVVILSERTGLPYMGLRTYDSHWNGGKYWYQQGYAANAGGTLYPYVQGPFAVVNEFPEPLGDLLEYAACDTPGDSGSPVWGWWSDGPHIIGLMTEVGYQLGANAGWGPGGQAMVNLVSWARSIWP